MKSKKKWFDYVAALPQLAGQCSFIIINIYNNISIKPYTESDQKASVGQRKISMEQLTPFPLVLPPSCQKRGKKATQPPTN